MKKLLLLAALSLATLATTGSAATTILGPSTYGGHTYYLIGSDDFGGLLWQDAEAAAVSQYGGHLVTINDAAENLWVLGNMVAPVDTAWLGYNDYAVEGNFVWSSGETPGYTNWAPGEPNNFFGFEDGTQMYNNGQWNDIFNDTQLYGVVEVGTNGVPDGGSTLVMLSLAVGACGLFQKRRAKQ
jgi:hypothetical protein